MIISPINNHANRIYSHRTGWGRMWANCLGSPVGFNADWSKENTVYLEHGMEWKEGAKSINYFLASEKQLLELAEENKERIAESKQPKQSAWEKLATKASMFETFEGRLVSLDIDCPMYGTLLKTRIKPWVPDVYKNLDFDKIDDVCKNSTTIRQVDLRSEYVVLGDSHSLSAWQSGAALCRNDGQTLNGAIKKGFETWLAPFDMAARVEGKGIQKLRTYFGNIDIRHHICRLYQGSDIVTETRVLAKNYFLELDRIKKLYDIKEIEVVAALPIENISRKLPKTGYYKGKPYWGSWQDRDIAMQIFNAVCKGLCQRLNGYSFVEWPDHFKNEAAELDTKFMERPQSVHISPEHYMWSI
jgi:hypothetical protein